MMYIKYWLYTSRFKVEILHKNSNARNIYIYIYKGDYSTFKYIN